MPSFFESAGLVLLGLLPSSIWLAFYYREDCHPEPKVMLARAFLTGVLISPLAIIFQLGFVKLAAVVSLVSESTFSSSVSFYLWASLVEEMIKFMAIWLVIIRRPEFDEPVDAMIYMIAAALGFAAMENILVTFQVIPSGATAAVTTLTLRFIGATLLHALASGVIGYFLAVSWFFRSHMKKIIIFGILVGTLMHFAFNIVIATAENQAFALLFTTCLLLGFALMVSILFDRLKHHMSRLILATET